MSYLEKNYLNIFGLLISLNPDLALSTQSVVIIFVLIVLSDYLISTSNCHSTDDNTN